MKRVVILGRGGAGKSTLARRLGEIAGLPVIELDKIFWQPGLTVTPREKWIAVQEEIVAADAWIIDGDLGPHDAVEARLQAADTVILLNFSFLRCALQAFRRSRERLDFWVWVVTYRYLWLPRLREAISKYAPSAALHVFREPAAVQRFLADIPSGVTKEKSAP
jgi:adenylate kinase family enzyme